MFNEIASFVCPNYVLADNSPGSNDDIGGPPNPQDDETQESSEAIAVKTEKRDMIDNITPNSTIRCVTRHLSNHNYILYYSLISIVTYIFVFAAMAINTISI